MADAVKVAPDAFPSPPLQLTLPLSPGEVRRLMFDAVAAGDEPKLDALCREHREVILENGDGWLEVPAEFRSSAEISEWYAKGLDAIARYCAEKVLDKGIRKEEATARDSAPNLVAKLK